MILYYIKIKKNIDISIGIQEDLKRGIEEGKYDLIFTTDNIQTELISSLKLFQPTKNLT